MRKAIQIVETYTEKDLGNFNRISTWEVGTCSFSTANFIVWKNGDEVGQHATLEAAINAVPARMR